MAVQFEGRDCEHVFFIRFVRVACVRQSAIIFIRSQVFPHYICFVYSSHFQRVCQKSRGAFVLPDGRLFSVRLVEQKQKPSVFHHSHYLVNEKTPRLVKARMHRRENTKKKRWPRGAFPDFERRVPLSPQPIPLGRAETREVWEKKKKKVSSSFSFDAVQQ